MFSGRTCSYRIRTALAHRDHRLAHHVLKVPSPSSPISITQGLYHWGLQICRRNSFNFSHFLCVSLKRLFLDSEPQVLTLLPQLWCQVPRLGIASGPLLPLQALWLPQCSYLAAFTSPQRKSAETADTLGSSVNTQVASCYRALHVPLMGVTVGRAQENSSPHPSSTAANQVNSSNLGHR